MLSNTAFNFGWQNIAHFPFLKEIDIEALAITGYNYFLGHVSTNRSVISNQIWTIFLQSSCTKTLLYPIYAFVGVYKVDKSKISPNII